MTEKSISAGFVVDKETLNTVRFKQVLDPGDRRNPTTYYLPKDDYLALGSPGAITITITSAD